MLLLFVIIVVVVVFFISFDVLVLFWELKSGLWKVTTNEWQGISESRIVFRPQTSTDTNNQTAFLERSTKLTSLQHHHHHCNHYQRQLKLIIGIHRFSSLSWLFSIRAMLSLSHSRTHSLAVIFSIWGWYAFTPTFGKYVRLCTIVHTYVCM